MYKAKINEIKYDISTNTTDIYELKIEKFATISFNRDSDFSKNVKL